MFKKEKEITMDIDSIKKEAQKIKSEYYEHDTVMRSLKKDFVTAMYKRLSSGGHDLYFVLPGIWSQSQLFKNEFFKFLNELGAKYEECFRDEYDQTRQIYPYYYLMVNLENV